MVANIPSTRAISSSRALRSSKNAGCSRPGREVRAGPPSHDSRLAEADLFLRDAGPAVSKRPSVSLRLNSEREKCGAHEVKRSVVKTAGGIVEELEIREGMGSAKRGRGLLQLGFGIQHCVFVRHTAIPSRSRFSAISSSRSRKNSSSCFESTSGTMTSA